MNNEKAETMYRDALIIYIDQLGSDHRSARRCAENLAVCYAKIGNRGGELNGLLGSFPHITVKHPELKVEYASSRGDGR